MLCLPGSVLSWKLIRFGKFFQIYISYFSEPFPNKKFELVLPEIMISKEAGKQANARKLPSVLRWSQPALKLQAEGACWPAGEKKNHPTSSTSTRWVPRLTRVPLPGLVGSLLARVPRRLSIPNKYSALFNGNPSEDESPTAIGDRIWCCSFGGMVVVRVRWQALLKLLDFGPKVLETHLLNSNKKSSNQIGILFLNEYVSICVS